MLLFASISFFTFLLLLLLPLTASLSSLSLFSLSLLSLSPVKLETKNNERITEERYGYTIFFFRIFSSARRGREKREPPLFSFSLSLSLLLFFSRNYFFFFGREGDIRIQILILKDFACQNPQKMMLTSWTS